jgi:hypothetical protein
MALTPREEALLRDQIIDKTPLRVVAGPTRDTTHHPNERNDHRLDEAMKLPKMAKTDLNDPEAIALDGRTRNYEITYRVKKFALKGEALGEFFCRTGLSLAGLRTMTDDQIKRHIALVAENDANEGFKVPPRGKQDVQVSGGIIQTLVDTYHGLIRSGEQSYARED